MKWKTKMNHRGTEAQGKSECRMLNAECSSISPYPSIAHFLGGFLARLQHQFLAILHVPSSILFGCGVSRDVSLCLWGEPVSL